MNLAISQLNFIYKNKGLVSYSLGALIYQPGLDNSSNSEFKVQIHCADLREGRWGPKKIVTCPKRVSLYLPILLIVFLARSKKWVVKSIELSLSMTLLSQSSMYRRTEGSQPWGQLWWTQGWELLRATSLPPQQSCVSCSQ